ncbi:MAG: hypothetical protein KIT56_00865 [Gammaproteobacteria bacterium]|nr:hypothetical protein [Gammaproteobacteria bacterium]MCW5582436.1 hypothetical protein [Gammaproteobacteria bacterium]
MNNPTVYILGSILIGLITSTFTVWLSLRRFRSEKLWEMKVDAYTKIIEALHKCKESLGYEEEYLIGIGTLSETQMGAWRRAFNQAEEELAKYRDIGALIISEQSVSLINRYHADRAPKSVDENDWVGRIGTHYEAAKECLAKLLVEAKKDLANK